VLTDKALKGLKPRKVLYEVPDSQGLSVRVNPAGRISFQYRYRANGKDARVKLGTYPGTTLAEARAAHQSARSMLDQGIDPAFQKKTDKLALSTAETVRHLADEFSTRFVAVHRKRPKDVAQIQGDLQYHNHASGTKVHSVMFTSFTIVGNTASFGGACTVNGTPCTFTVDVEDNGEPGTNDKFTITVDAGPPEGGTLRSGNIQIHH
jgi:Arm domain-containing DNA-binding protein